MTQRKPKQPSVWVVERCGTNGRWGPPMAMFASLAFDNETEARVRADNLPANYRVREYRRVPTKRPKARRKP